jgi:hypothetical protein
VLVAVATALFLVPSSAEAQKQSARADAQGAETEADTERDGSSTSESSGYDDYLARLRAGDLQPRTRLNLIRAASERAPTVSDALEAIRAHREPLGGDQLAEAHALEADFLALSANLQAAADAYAEAARLSSGATALSYLLEEAQLRFETGENEKAAQLAERLIAEARDPAVQRRAALLTARAAAAEGDLDRALRTVRLLSQAEHRPTLQPETLLFLARLAARLENETETARARALLQKLYPESPEAMLAAERRETVRELPRPSALLGLEASLPARAEPESPEDPEADPTADAVTSSQEGGTEDVPTGVQVGSFRDPENAGDMQREAVRLGLEAKVFDSSEGSFHRVIIPVEDREAARRIILELKENGFEGFLVFGGAGSTP